MTPAALMALLGGDTENAMAALTPGGIEAQEKAGQQELVNSTRLPKEILHSTKEMFESLGFEFGEEVDGLFVECKLPDGWSKKASDHDMWSKIIDERGRERASVFYKAAFYDRKAHMSLDSFISTKTEPINGYKNKQENDPYVGKVENANGDLLYQTGKFQDYGEARDLVSNWVKDNYPDCYDDPTAYWD